MAHDTNGKIQPRSPIAIVRLDDLEQAVEISRALLAGGIVAQEFTLTNPRALEALAQVKKKLPGELLLGAGTVLDAEMARSSIAAGAEFLVTPAFLVDVIAVGRSAGIPVLCGAFTPTEILGAWRAGADLVKVFPAGGIGPAYINDVLGPLPTIPLVPTGGVNLDNCAAFLAAGAYTVAIGSSLVNKELVRRQDWPALIELARRYVQACTPG
ncbi:MAG: bifunctional 4-hydroxy-2-oxoglutarate aldolase/2-dehydro-3-deoxy-phosphogluconate aldolase [Ktedonobacteraceae bacterium]